jgi:23S rRNA pseudouridine1911/1915/1917 synthase
VAADERVVVGDDASGRRLDQVLSALASVGSRAKARQTLETGKVTVDGQPVDGSHAGRALGAGAVVVVAWNRPGTSPKRAAGREKLVSAGVTVVYEDDDLLAVDKPVGLLTDAASLDQAREEDTLTKRARAWVGHGGVHPVHRIDRDTTGLVLFAKTPFAHDNLKLQWGARTPLRQYLVVVEGAVRGDMGHFADWMRWDGKGRRQRPCRPGTEDGVLAEADWRLRERFGDVAAMLEVRLVSGRRNQIRLHAELWGHPLVGERLYRRTPASVSFTRQALHAERLGVVHPRDGRAMSFEAPIPSDLRQLIQRLRRPPPADRSRESRG